MFGDNDKQLWSFVGFLFTLENIMSVKRNLSLCSVCVDSNLLVVSCHRYKRKVSLRKIFVFRTSPSYSDSIIESHWFVSKSQCDLSFLYSRVVLADWLSSE